MDGCPECPSIHPSSTVYWAIGATVSAEIARLPWTQTPPPANLVLPRGWSHSPSSMSCVVGHAQNDGWARYFLRQGLSTDPGGCRGLDLDCPIRQLTPRCQEPIDPKQRGNCSMDILAKFHWVKIWAPWTQVKKRLFVSPCTAGWYDTTTVCASSRRALNCKLLQSVLQMWYQADQSCTWLLSFQFLQLATEKKKREKSPVVTQRRQFSPNRPTHCCCCCCSRTPWTASTHPFLKKGKTKEKKSGFYVSCLYNVVERDCSRAGSSRLFF